MPNDRTQTAYPADGGRIPGSDEIGRPGGVINGGARGSARNCTVFREAGARGRDGDVGDGADQRVASPTRATSAPGRGNSGEAGGHRHIVNMPGSSATHTRKGQGRRCRSMRSPFDAVISGTSWAFLAAGVHGDDQKGGAHPQWLVGGRPLRQLRAVQLRGDESRRHRPHEGGGA